MRLTHIAFILTSLCVLPDLNSVSVLKSWLCRQFWAHPVYTEKWHFQEPVEANIDVWRDYVLVKFERHFLPKSYT